MAHADTAHAGHGTAQAGESRHGHAVGQSDKKIALLISVLTLFVALSETFGKASQTSALSYNVEATDLWAFQQAKTLRAATLRTAADALQLDLVATGDPAAKAAMQKRIDSWQKDAARYESEPSSNEGSRELTARAIHNLSHRAAHPFVVIGCADFSEPLIEAERNRLKWLMTCGAVVSRMLTTCSSGIISDVRDRA